MYASPEIIGKSIEIGENIKQWRKLQGINKKQLAIKLHISAKVLRKIENNQLHISTLQIRIIAAQLQIAFTQLFNNPPVNYSANLSDNY